MKRSKRRANLLSTVSTLACVALAPLAARAEGRETATPISVAASDAAERVELAHLMTTLSQETASAACHLHHGIDTETSRQMLQEALADFTTYLRGLIYGNETLKISGIEEDRQTLARLIRVSDIWTPIRKAIKDILKDPEDTAALSVIKAQNIPLHDAAALLLSEIVGVYANPVELLQTDALMIQFAGRQATLAQRMAKDACRIWTGDRSDALLRDFDKTMALYEATLQALLDGMAEVGIKPAPNPRIKEALEREMNRWQQIKANLLAVRDYANVSDQTKADIFAGLNDAMAASRQIARLYVAHARHDYH